MVSKIDLILGDNLVGIEEGDEWKSVFHIHYSNKEYRIIGFGMHNAPATFRNIMSVINQD
jgi:hypothetical protein